MNYIALAIDGKRVDFKTNERLMKALEFKLFEDQEGHWSEIGGKIITITSEWPSPMKAYRVKGLTGILQKRKAFCHNKMRRVVGIHELPEHLVDGRFRFYDRLKKANRQHQVPTRSSQRQAQRLAHDRNGRLMGGARRLEPSSRA